MIAVDVASATAFQAHPRHDARFDLPPEEVPYSGIALAVFLTVFGATCFVLAWMHFTQVIFGKEQAVSDAVQVTTSRCDGPASVCTAAELAMRCCQQGPALTFV
jgi:hypothetical protein